MATIYSNTPWNAYRLKLDISQQSQSIPNNNSVIAYTLTMECLQPNNYGYSYPAGDKFTVTINGTTVFNSQVAIALGPAIHSKQICTGTTTVGHNADGSKSISFSCHKDACPLGGWTPPAMDASGSMTLSTIPRASVPTLNKTSMNIGDSIVITTNRVTTAFVHQINFSTDGGSTWTNITNGVTDSYTWTPSLDLLGPRFPNATSGKVRIGVDTYPSNNTHNYDKTTRIGWKWVEFNVNFPETSSIKPACGMSSVQEAGSGIPSGWGYVQGYSKLKLSGSSAVKGGANLLSTIVTADGKNYSVGNGSTWSVVTDTIKNSGSMYLSATCKDSRGYTDTGGQTVTVNAYSPPNPTLSLYRCDSAGNANDAGTYAKVTYAWSISSVGSKNAVKSGLVRYRKKGDSAWTSIVNSTTSNVASTTTTLSGFNVDYAYEFNISVQDGLRTVSKTVTLPAQTVPLYIAPDGKSVTFGSTQVTQGCLRSELPLDFKTIRRENIPNNSNLNNYTRSGHYVSTSAGNTITNNPSGVNAFCLDVYSYDGNLMDGTVQSWMYITQKLEAHNATGIWVRQGQTGSSTTITWGPWQVIQATGLSDWVVEIGSSGTSSGGNGWHWYRKWHSGKAEVLGCYWNYDCALTQIGTSGIYCQNMSVSLPFAMKNVLLIGNSQYSTDHNLPCSAMNFSGEMVTSLVGQKYDFYARSGAQMKIGWYAVGSWK